MYKITCYLPKPNVLWIECLVDGKGLDPQWCALTFVVIFLSQGLKSLPMSEHYESHRVLDVK